MNLHTHHEVKTETAPFVDLKQFLGDWYIIANIPTSLETQSYNAVESFHWNESEKRLDVNYHFNEGGPFGPLHRYPQKAWISDEKTNAEWKVQFVWPLKLPYKVLDVASDYSWAIIGTARKNFVWIMARRPSLDFGTYHLLLDKLSSLGYDTSKIRKVPQIWDPVS